MQTFIRARWVAVGLLLGSVVALFAQEPQVSQRGFIAVRGNVVASTGYTLSGGSPARDFRTNTSYTTDANVTLTAAQVLTGLVTFGGAQTAARTVTLPTASDLATAIPGIATGHSFWFVLDTNNPNATVTMNGASTGVTYSDGCSTALTTSGGYPVLIVFTSTSAYRAVCLHGDV